MILYTYMRALRIYETTVQRIRENRCLCTHPTAADVTRRDPFHIHRDCFSLGIAAYNSWY